MSLIALTSMATYLDPDMRVRELAHIARVLDHVPVFDLHAGGIASLGDTCAMVVDRARERSAYR
jgi:hypothetical protein